MTAERWRDRYFEVRAGRGAMAEFLAEIAQFDPPPTTRLRGLALSCCPSRRFVQLRFLDVNELDAEVRDRFARPCASLPEVAAVFVDPADLSYHCFESIVGLDGLFEAVDEHAIDLAKRPSLVRDAVIHRSASLSGPLRAALAGLDSLDLWLEPHSPTRGGRRFIFHAAKLADALTVALRRSLTKANLTKAKSTKAKSTKTDLGAFVHVNPVFRCNRFDPGDARFEAHVDSPFSWSARKLVSTHTLLLYLTGGKGKDLLRFGGAAAIDEIVAGDLFVFDQALEHEGGPFDAGPKIFLRSELIVHEPGLVDSPDLAAGFAKACWLDGQIGAADPFGPTLARFANAQYDRVARARRRPALASSGGPVEEPFVHHEFAGVHFVTNGYDGYFRKADVGPQDAAALMLLELLNPMIDEVPFRGIAKREVLVRSGQDPGWITAFLAAFEPPAEPPFCELDYYSLFPEAEEAGPYHIVPRSLDFAPLPTDWDSCRESQVIEAYVRAQRWAKARIVSAPITMLGKQVFLAPERFVIHGDKIHLVGSESLGPLHFAGAVMLEIDDFIDVDVVIGTLRPIVPPIEFHAQGELLHLTCDLFRNAWMMADVQADAIPVPTILPGDEVTGDYPRWRYAATNKARNDAQLDRELEEDNDV